VRDRQLSATPQGDSGGHRQERRREVGVRVRSTRRSIQGCVRQY
jgi:hypothetical protein